MKFYYKDLGYTCTWKTKMLPGMWYNMEQAKIKVKIPSDIYREIAIKDELYFKILKNRGEKLYFNNSDDSDLEIWLVTGILDSAIICSDIKNELIVNLHIRVIKSTLLGKDELRDIILKEVLL